MRGDLSENGLKNWQIKEWSDWLRLLIRRNAVARLGSCSWNGTKERMKYMILLFTGTPGSGKSLNMAKKIKSQLLFGRNVIGTMAVDQSRLKKRKGKYIYCDIYKLNPTELIEYAKKNHKKGREGQTIIVIDECQRIFNSRDWQNPKMRKWNDFFQVHRHFGFDVWLVTQFDRLIDRQLRALIEYNYIHRKVSRYGITGFFAGLLFRGGLFIEVEQWYPLKEKTGSSFFLFSKRLASFYDSYVEFDGGADVNELAPLLEDDLEAGD